TDLTVAADGSASSDADGTVASYSWNFGDDTPATTGATASHTYAAAGTYSVVLTVTDDKGATNAVTKSVTVTAPPVPNKAPVAAAS
ncbi:PKD domain-containing protein, partial [Arthrobacter bussei]